MSDYNEGSRRRDRHRRHKNPGTKNAPNNQREAQNPRESRSERPDRPERSEKRVEMPPLPKLPTLTCVKCGEPIQDSTSAMVDKGSGGPIHFDCVITFLQGAENLGLNEKIVYIGQGKFAVMFFENPLDTKKFRIVRTIEWEGRETRAEWRTDISDRFSHIK